VKEGTVQPKEPELSRIAKHLMLAILVIAAGGCKGSIEGKVVGTNGEPGVPVTGHPVYLVAASPETAAALKAVCPAMGAATFATQAAAERQRLSDLSAHYGDSLHEELVTRRDARRVTELRNAMTVYHDSAAAVASRPPPVPVTLIETLAMKQMSSEDDGSYAFTNIPPGRYLVAVELTNGYRWLPVQVGRRTAVANVSPLGSKEGCEIAQSL
jgi:hypothetical protein